MVHTFLVQALNSSEVRSDVPLLRVCVTLLAMNTGSATARRTGLLADRHEPQAVDVTTSSGSRVLIQVNCSRGKNPICSSADHSRGATMTDQASPFAPAGLHRLRDSRRCGVRSTGT